MAAESIRVTRSVSIQRSEIELRFSRSSGPGGQHAQKTETRVEAVFDVERSVGLTDAQKRRVLGRNAVAWFGLTPTELPETSVYFQREAEVVALRG